MYVNESEVGALVARGYLPEEARDDPVAIKAAIVVVISDLAFELARAVQGDGTAHTGKACKFHLREKR